MSRIAEFEASLRKARRRVYQMIGERSRNFGEELSRRLCEVFAYRAQERLIKYSTPKDSQSAMQVRELASTIVAKSSSTGKGYEVSIPVDEEGLLLFLEYGTGLVGEANEHEEASAVGWRYAINRELYTKGGGWFFDRYPTRGDETSIAYVDANDITPVISKTTRTSNSQWVSGYTRKDGVVVKRYHRKRANPKTTTYERERRGIVWSRGLVPVKFIYNTKQELREILDLFRSYKGGKLTFKDVFDKIDELERRAV